MTYDLEHLGRQVDKLSDAIEENTNEKGENNMNDIAGLLALMQGNKGMDLPGLHGSHHYATASFQESMHMFLALDDFFTALIPLLTAEEKAEWSKFRTSLPE